MKRLLFLLLITQQVQAQTNIAVPSYSSVTNTFNPATGNIKFYLNGVSQTLSVGHGANGICFYGNNMFVAYDDNSSNGHGLLWYKNVSFSSGTFASDAPVILANNQQTFQVVADGGGNIYSANMDGTITKFMPAAGVYSSANKVTVRFFSNGSYILGGLMVDNNLNTLWATSYSLNTLAVCRLTDFPNNTSYITTSTPATFIKPVTISANYLQAPEGVVTDELGNIWISNNNNNYAVRINSSSAISVITEINASNYSAKNLIGGTDANTWAVSANGEQLGGMVYDNLYSKKIYVNNQANGGNTFQYEFLPTNGVPTFNITSFAQVFPGNGQSAIIPCALLPTPSNPTANGTTINSGQTANLTASNCSADQTYLWKQGVSLMATTANFTTPTLTNTTTYTVYCVRGGACQSSGTNVVVTVNNGGGVNPPIISGNPLTICEGENTSLTATGCSGGVITWSTGQTGTYIFPYPTVTTTYTATCTIASNSSGPSNEVTITVNPNPVVEVSSSLPIENIYGNDYIYIHAGQSVTLTATNCSGSVLWSFGGSTANTNSISLTADNSGEYNMMYVQLNCTNASLCNNYGYITLLKQFATNDTFTTNVNTPVTGNVKDNDLESTMPYPYTVTGVQHGTVVWQMQMGRPTGVLTYTPDNGFVGTDSLVYHLTDDLTFSKTATVKFVVGNNCVENLIVSGNDYPSNTISGIATLSASSSVRTIENIVPSNDPAYIQTSIGANASVIFQAGNSITLNPGFKTEAGAVFTANIGACINSGGVAHLKVQGTKIKNKCGTDFVMRGVNFGGYWQYDVNNRMNTLNRIKEIKKSGTNTVRLPWSANTQYSRDYKVLDTLLKHIVASKMIAMVEFHDLTCQNLTPANIQIATNYWTSANVLAVLKKYENYLILNIANEVGSDWQGNTPVVVQKMIDAYTPSIVTLRNAGLKCPITIDATDCGQNIEALVSAAPTLLASDPDHNLIFSAHLYWNNDNYTTRLTNAYNNAVAAGICLIVGEFAVAQDCMLNSTPNDYVAIMQVCNQYSIGYLAWEWGGSQQYAGNGSLCPDDSRGVGYSRLTMTGSSGMYADRAGWGATVVTDIQNTSVESCQFNP